MKIYFLGVGEACDPNLPNTSILLLNDNDQAQVLLDCGFTTPHRYFKTHSDPEELKVIWISHFHGDHFFGIPLILLKFWELGRTGRLSIIGPKGVEQKVRQVMELAYPKFVDRLQYPLSFFEAQENDHIQIDKMSFKTINSIHSQQALAIRIEDGKHSLYYSGDGQPSPTATDFASRCDLIIQESFCFHGSVSGHCSVREALEFAQNCQCSNLALVHMSGEQRRLYLEEAKEYVANNADVVVFFPGSGDYFNFDN